MLLTQWLTKNRNVFLIVLKVVMSTIMAPTGLVCGESSFAHGWPCSHWKLTSRKGLGTSVWPVL